MAQCVCDNAAVAKMAFRELSAGHPARFAAVAGHAGVALSVAFASGEMRHFVAVYSTFLQRAIDHVVHDVCIARLPVVFCIENGCIASGFGETIGADMKFGRPDEFVPHGSVESLERKFGLDADAIAAAILKKYPDGA